MSTNPLVHIQELVIDIPADRDSEVAHFYAALLGYDGAEDASTNPRNPWLGRKGFIDLGLQRVQDYQPPTWPSQERGQQIHLDVAVDDLEAAVTAAIAIGAVDTGAGSDDHRVMLDPVGHPFCLVSAAESAIENASEGRVGTLRGIAIDSADPMQSANFYHALIGGELTEYPGGWAAVTGVTNPGLYFQPVPEFVPNTWPSQERGQQMHFDCAAEDVGSVKARVLELGGSLAFEIDEHPGFAILRDPAGHLFCFSQG